MAEVVWGQLAKSVTDKTTIDEEIDSKIQTHNEDPSAHKQADEAIDVHRTAEILDHLDESITNLKLKSKVRAYAAIVDAAGNYDYTDIQSAIDYVHSIGGGIIFVRSGTYTPGADITLYENITLLGEDDDNTIIDFENGNYRIKIIWNGETPLYNVHLKNLSTIRSRHSSSYAVYFEGIRNFSITSCYFYDNYHFVDPNYYGDIHLSDCWDGSVRFNRFEDSGRDILVTNNTAAVDISFNHFSLCYREGIHITDSDAIIVLGNSMSLPDCWYGIVVDGNSKCSVINNYIYNGIVAGIYIEASGTLIQGNYVWNISDGGGTGISVVNGNKNRIIGNFVCNCKSYGIHISGNNNIVTGNVMESNTEANFYDEGTDTQIGHNIEI